MSEARESTAAKGQARYVPALGRDSLTMLYDPVLKLATRERTFKERLLRQAHLGDGVEVLDLGCGTGTLAVWAKQRVPAASIVGLDGDERMLAKARAKAARAGVEIGFDQGLSVDLPYPDGSFDRVVTSLFFHHLTDRDKERTIGEIRRVLREAGELHVADWGEPADPFMSALSQSIRLLDGSETTRANLAGELPGLFERGGLRNVRTHGGLRTISGSLAFYSAER
jgi:cyclopropane fatty-acyl-phospholipid synthase-like methyltransferase